MFIQSNSSLLPGISSPQPGRADSIAPNEKAFDSILQNTNKTVDEKNKGIDRDIALIKEVGFFEYQIIMKTVHQIERALVRARDDFLEYQEDLEGIENLFADKLPSSVAEAMAKLDEVLEDVPEEIKKSFKERVLKYLEEEKQKDERIVCRTSTILEPWNAF